MTVIDEERAVKQTLILDSGIRQLKSVQNFLLEHKHVVKQVHDQINRLD